MWVSPEIETMVLKNVWEVCGKWWIIGVCCNAPHLSVPRQTLRVCFYKWGHPGGGRNATLKAEGHLGMLLKLN